jgi:hypothetical protein
MSVTALYCSQCCIVFNVNAVISAALAVRCILCPYGRNPVFTAPGTTMGGVFTRLGAGFTRPGVLPVHYFAGCCWWR